MLFTDVPNFLEISSHHAPEDMSETKDQVVFFTSDSGMDFITSDLVVTMSTQYSLIPRPHVGGKTGWE